MKWKAENLDEPFWQYWTNEDSVKLRKLSYTISPNSAQLLESTRKLMFSLQNHRLIQEGLANNTEQETKRLLSPTRQAQIRGC
jgi:hypothetical protein